jgi:hypothetical protein
MKKEKKPVHAFRLRYGNQCSRLISRGLNRDGGTPMNLLEDVTSY